MMHAWSFSMREMFQIYRHTHTHVFLTPERLKFKCNQIHNYVLYTQAELLKHVKTIWLMRMIIWLIWGWSATTGTLIVSPSPSSTAAVPFWGFRAWLWAPRNMAVQSPKQHDGLLLRQGVKPFNGSIVLSHCEAGNAVTKSMKAMANGDFLKKQNTCSYSIYASKKNNSAPS